ncbi:MAG: hypothetical protein GVY18_00455 [Bacteroidetes bacterium]|jgi:hypothetical protein|nr:hypothetical protein [Bacteroidota bacterium]
MVTIHIGPDERTLDDRYEPWVTQQITRRRQAGQSVCVRVTIKDGDVRFTLTTPDCPSTGGGGFSPNRREQQIIDIWNRHDLGEGDLAPGQVIAFLKQLEGIV